MRRIFAFRQDLTKRRLPNRGDIITKLDDTGVITLKNIMKIPGYIAMTYGDEEEYKEHLR